MSKGYSGHFIGTNNNASGTNTITKNKGNKSNSNETSTTNTQNTKTKKTYTATKTLINHILNPEPSPSSKKGIVGAHHKENFYNEVNRIGAKIIDTTPSSKIDGIERISYKLPKKNIYGQTTGEYQSKTHHKTVYDTSKINTDQYINRGLQAANNAAINNKEGKLEREWTGLDDYGVKWHGYCDNNGNITSFYPEE